ncbi:MAG: Na-translocating system protein MpsC family protein [Bacillota bacterium]
MYNYQISRAYRIECERAIVDFAAKFVKEMTGKGPRVVKAKILEELIHIHFEGYLTDLEKSLLNSSNGVTLVEKIRNELHEVYKDDYLEQIRKILKKDVDFLHISRNPLEDRAKVTIIIK